MKTILIFLLIALLAGSMFAQENLQVKQRKDAIKLMWDEDALAEADEYLIFWNFGIDTTLFVLVDSASYDDIWEWQIGSVSYGLSDKSYEYFYVETKAEMKNTWLRLGVIAISNGEKSPLSIINEVIEVKRVPRPKNVRAN